MLRTPPRSRLAALAIAGLTGLAVLAGCQPSEAPRVELAVVVDGSEVQGASNELGWDIELTEASVAIADLRMTTAGELHEDDRSEAAPTGLRAHLGALFIARAWAHPGHFQDGEVIGELPGAYVIDFVADDGRELGLATLIVGDYTAANFALDRAIFAGGEHSALIRGVARHDDIDGAPAEVAFTVRIDSPSDRVITGVPFEASIEETSSFALGLRMLGVDPYEGDGLFTAIDFAALDAADGAADGTLELVDPETVDPDQVDALSDAYYAIRREFQSHDLFELRPL